MPKDTKTLCIKKGCASVLTQPLFCLYTFLSDFWVLLLIFYDSAKFIFFFFCYFGMNIYFCGVLLS